MSVSTPRSVARPPATTEIKVAQRIAALRLESRMTLRELAERSGLSDSYLNRVERQKAAINIANLEKVAAAFGVGVADFFDATKSRQPPVVVTRAAAGRRVRFRGRDGFRVELLADAMKGKLMEPILVDLASARGEVPPQSHPGQEFNHVLEGRCLFVYGKDRLELTAGDSVYFDATVPHVCRALGDGPSRLLAVIASPDYPLHSDIAVLLDDR